MQQRLIGAAFACAGVVFLGASMPSAAGQVVAEWPPFGTDDQSWIDHWIHGEYEQHDEIGSFIDRHWAAHSWHFNADTSGDGEPNADGSFGIDSNALCTVRVGLGFGATQAATSIDRLVLPFTAPNTGRYLVTADLTHSRWLGAVGDGVVALSDESFELRARLSLAEGTEASYTRLRTFNLSYIRDDDAFNDVLPEATLEIALSAVSLGSAKLAKLGLISTRVEVFVRFGEQVAELLSDAYQLSKSLVELIEHAIVTEPRNIQYTIDLDAGQPYFFELEHSVHVVAASSGIIGLQFVHGELRTQINSLTVEYIPGSLDLRDNGPWLVQTDEPLHIDGVVLTDGTPEEGTTIEVTLDTGTGPQLSGSGVTDASGVFDVQFAIGLPIGEHAVQIDAVAMDGRSATSSSWVDVADATGGGTDNTLDLLISPALVQLNDGDSFELLAEVRDGSGTPAAGAEVDFYWLSGVAGVWEDIAGNQIAGPDNGPTDALGQRATYFRPLDNGPYQFAAVSEDASDQGTGSAVWASSDQLEIFTPTLQSRGPGYAEFNVRATIAAPPGGFTPDGCMKFTTDRGWWTEGPGAGSAVTITDITAGSALTELHIETSGPTLITVELCATDSDCGDMVSDCLDSSVQASRSFSLSHDVPPLVAPGHTIMGATNADIQALSSDGLTIGFVEWNEAAYMVDFYTLETVCAQPASSTWDSCKLTAMSPDGSSFFAFAFSDGIGVFDPANCQVSALGCSAGLDINDDASASPDGTQVAVLLEDSGTRDIISIRDSQGCFVRSTSIGPSGSETKAKGISWSSVGSVSQQRIAVTYELESATGYPNYVQLYRASDLATVGGPILLDNNRPGDTEWSPNGQILAAHDGDETLYFFNSSGGTSGVPSPINTSGDDGTTLAWSYDSQMIAFDFRDGTILIYDVWSGEMLARLNDAGTTVAAYATLAWRSDDKVVAVTDRNTEYIELFAPFDSGPPSFSGLDPATGASLPASMDQVDITGVVSDDSALRPDSLEYRVNSGGWIALGNDAGGLDRSESFSFTAALQPGTNIIELTASDLRGQVANASVTIFRGDDPAVEVTILDGSLVNTACEMPPLDIGTVTLGELGQGIEFFVEVTEGASVGFGEIVPPAGFIVVGDLPPVLFANESDSFIVIPDSSVVGAFSGCLTIDTTMDPPSIIAISLQATVEGSPGCSGDIDGDGITGVYDFGILATHFEQYVTPDTNGDLDGDGLVTVFDFGIFAADFECVE